MRRWALVPVLAILAMATACIPAPPPPPPPGWVPPVIESVELSTDQMSAGSRFTVSVDASDDERVRSLSIGFSQPDGSRYGFIRCTLEGVESLANTWFLATPSPRVEAFFDCTMPPMPNRGIWTIEVSASDSNGSHTGQMPVEQRTFEVAEGPEDFIAPALDSVRISPDPVPTGSWFDATVLITDDTALAPVVSEPTMGYWGTHYNAYIRPCFDPRLTVISPTVHEWRFRCQANTDGKFGTYVGSVDFHDAAGNHGSATFEFEMVPRA